MVGPATAAAWLVAPALGVTPLVVGVALGAALGNIGRLPQAAAAGIHTASTTFLRAGVILLGLRLSLTDLAGLGGGGVTAVAAGVVATFAGIRWLAKRIGVSPDLGLLLATGYAVCGASAIVAMDGVTGADEEDVAFAVGLVTLYGSLSIVALPAVAGLVGLEPPRFGAWSGAAVHDVGQVVATASSGGSQALATAVVVKLSRVLLLAPLVTAVSLARSRSQPAGAPPRPLPAFVAGFLAMVVVRTIGIVPPSALATAGQAEGVLLCAAMVRSAAVSACDGCGASEPAPTSSG